MIVCNCRGVSDRDIQAAIDGGARCLDSLEQRGIGGDCRGCESALRDMIRQCGQSGACQACCAEEPELASA